MPRNHFLTHKHNRIAVNEFSLALFLVPDNPVRIRQLHAGHAHALNRQKKIESVKNDVLMVLRCILQDREEDVSATEAYSVLGKTHAIHEKT